MELLENERRCYAKKRFDQYDFTEYDFTHATLEDEVEVTAAFGSSDYKQCADCGTRLELTAKKCTAKAGGCLKTSEKQDKKLLRYTKYGVLVDGDEIKCVYDRKIPILKSSEYVSSDSTTPGIDGSAKI